MGYHRAGFEVIGVDLKPQSHFPFRFVQGDAIEVGRELLAAEHFDAIHASPPCQAFSTATKFHRGRADQHPNLIPPMRELLIESRLPFVIENVPGAPLVNPITLCGTMFDGLKVYRHRLFETHPAIYFPPYHNPHLHRPTEVGRPVADHGWMTIAGHFGSIDAARVAMGIDWMTRDELAQAIPPAYTEWLGAHLLAAVEVAA